METENVALLVSAVAALISLISVLLAGLSIGWNIYRDVLLKPKLRVDISISSLIGPDLPADPRETEHIAVSAVNHGPGGAIICQGLHMKDASLWRRIRRKTKHYWVIHDWKNPLSDQFPKVLQVGERINLMLPFEEKCLLKSEPTHIGIGDSFGRTHWVPRRQVKEVNANYRERFRKTRDTAPPAATG